MMNLKNLNIKAIGDFVILSTILIAIVTIFMTIVSKILVTVLPGVFPAHLTLVEVLLFLILVKLHSK